MKSKKFIIIIMFSFLLAVCTVGLFAHTEKNVSASEALPINLDESATATFMLYFDISDGYIDSYEYGELSSDNGIEMFFDEVINLDTFVYYPPDGYDFSHWCCDNDNVNLSSFPTIQYPFSHLIVSYYDLYDLTVFGEQELFLTLYPHLEYLGEEYEVYIHGNGGEDISFFSPAGTIIDFNYLSDYMYRFGYSLSHFMCDDWGNGSSGFYGSLTSNFWSVTLYEPLVFGAVWSPLTIQVRYSADFYYIYDGVGRFDKTYYREPYVLEQEFGSEILATPPIMPFGERRVFSGWCVSVGGVKVPLAVEVNGVLRGVILDDTLDYSILNNQPFSVTISSEYIEDDVIFGVLPDLGGYDLGYADGFSNGAALNSTAPNFFSRIFDSIGDLLNLSLFPGITVGILLFVPLVFGIILFVIKFVT